MHCTQAKAQALKHLDAQAAVQKELASLQSAHAGLHAEHTRAQTELAVAEERLAGLQDLQLSHDGLQVRTAIPGLSSMGESEWPASMCLADPPRRPSSSGLLWEAAQPMTFLLPFKGHKFNAW